MVTGISPDNEAFLDLVVATGQFPSREAALDEAIRVLRQQSELDSSELKPPRESTDQWIARLRDWAASRPGVEGFVDDSRESIY